MRHHALLLSLLLASPFAAASESGDSLSKCLADAASKDDRRALVRWIYTAISVHPDLRDVSSIDDARRSALEADAAKVMQRLVADDCAAPVKRVLLTDGAEGFGTAFETLGRIAMEEFIAQPDVQRASMGIMDRVDRQRILRALLTK